MTSGATADLVGVWGGGGSDVFAAGDSGTILHYVGTSWSAMSSGAVNDFRGVFVVLSPAPVRAEGLLAELELDSQWLGAGDDLVASVTIVNRSTRSVLVPRWLVPGARLEANLFAVTRDGEPVAYRGRLVKRAAPGAGDFVTLAPGATLRGTTELTKHYDLRDGGEYVVTFRVDLLGGVGAGGFAGGAAFAPPAPLSEAVESNSLAVWRDGPAAEPVPVWVASPVGEGSLTTLNCSTSQAAAAATAVTNALSYATGAKSYLDSRSWSTVGARYTTWFGAPASSRFQTVSNHFNAIRSAFQSAPVTVDCSRPGKRLARGSRWLSGPSSGSAAER
jgi:peptidyl-Lys metalloendopeptidase